MSRFSFVFAVFSLLEANACLGRAQVPSRHALVVVSIDGMHPGYISDADQYHLKIPVLRRLYRTGAHAPGVRGVLPTVTFPSHTTLVTGVWPARHGIFNNTIFDPTGKDLGDWYWYSEDIRVPTLWKAAADAGYTVGSVSWPVSVSAQGITYNIPEYWRTFTSQEMKLLRALSTRGLMDEFEKDVGPYTNDLNDAIPGDWKRARYSEALIRKKHADFVTLHLASLDHLEHAHSPFSAEAFQTLEAIDGMVGVLEKAILDADPSGAIAVVSDHGFATVDHQFNPSVDLVQNGLITVDRTQQRARGTGVSDWKAILWTAGGSAAVILKDEHDAATRTKLQALVKGWVANAENGIDRVLTRQQVKELGGDPRAEFVIDMKRGYSVGSSMDGPLVRVIPTGGTHGYAPMHPEMQASFFIAGPSIKTGLDLGQIDMRSVAPTLARFLQVPLPSADLPSLSVQTEKGSQKKDR